MDTCQAEKPQDLETPHLNLPDSPGNNGLQNRASVIVEQVDFINDQEPDQLRVDAITALPRDDIPLLWGGHNDLGLLNLRLRQVHVACQLTYLDAIALQALAEVAHLWKAISTDQPVSYLCFV